MHDQVIGWDEELPVDDDQVMIDRYATSSKVVRASDGTVFGVASILSSADFNEAETTAVDGGAAPGSGIGVIGGRDAVSHFGSLG